MFTSLLLQVLLDHEEGIQLCSVTELYHHNTPLHVAARVGKVQALKVITLPSDAHWAAVYIPLLKVIYEFADFSANWYSRIDCLYLS